MAVMGASFEGQVALVTGAGTGIGAATARLLAGRGAAVTVAGRRTEPLEEVAGHPRGGWPRAGKPKPGSDGTMTSKASAGSPPKAAGSASCGPRPGPMIVTSPIGLAAAGGQPAAPGG
jgi:NAD(P)-dependent dehydrogenase (short-subunit alcohol dehydrogenase family)